MTQPSYFTTLKDRGEIRISGTDRRNFLQNLISNDITLLADQPCVYACLLTPQGKFLYDFFITERDGVLYLDCEGGVRARDLAKLLTLYKLRTAIDIDIEENVPVYAIIGSDAHGGYHDPRHIDMGYRTSVKPDELAEKPFDHWDLLRIGLTIPDGSRDMVPEKSTLLECRIDALHGLSYGKGCYIGQELTARMHYRGLAKKHLYTVTAPDIDMERLPASGTAIEINGKTIGEMRSSCGDVGLALLKDEAQKHLKAV